MSLIMSVLTLLLLVGLPAAAAIRWSRRALPERANGVIAGLALGYGGIGLAAIALWLGTALLGMSASSVALSIVTVSLMLWFGAGRRIAGRPSAHAEPWRSVVALGVLSALVVGLPFLTHGLERDDGLRRIAMTDWEHHLVLATGIAGADRFPPPHPYLHADPDPAYYFGYDLVAGAGQVASGYRADTFAILLAMTLLTAAATPIIVYLLARDLVQPPSALLAAAGSSLLVGFDVLVMLVKAIRNTVLHWPLAPGFEGVREVVPSMHIDSWIHNLDRQFSAPLVTTMWAPHQTAATLVALLALYLLSPAREARDDSPRTWLLPALLIASLPALSAYVAFGLALGIAATIVLQAWRGRAAPWDTATFRRWSPPGLIAVVFALPVLPTLSGGSSSGLVLATSVAGDWTNGAVFSSLFGASWWTALLDSPAVYLVDFGMVGLLAGLELWRRRGEPRSAAQQQAIVVALSIAIFVLVVRPPLGIGNNLYARALLLPWFLLAPFAATAALRSARRSWVATGVLICALGTGYVVSGYLVESLVFLRVSPEKVAALRWINKHIEPSELIAIEPDRFGIEVGIWSRRPLSYANRRLALLFGATEDEVERAETLLAEGYGAASPALAARAFDELEATAIIAAARPLPGWALPPCFERAFVNAEWLVIRRTGASCEIP